MEIEKSFEKETNMDSNFDDVQDDKLEQINKDLGAYLE